MKKKLISIVTVCYNAQNCLEKTIQSIISQKFSDKEYIVIDGNSKDNTSLIFQKYRSDIDVLISEKDNGIYNAMNKGIDLATGEWIIFMNAGDMFVNNEVLTNVAENLKPDFDVVYGDILVNKNGNLVVKEAPSIIKNIHRMPFCHQAVFTRSDLLQKYHFDEKYSLSSDYKFFKKLILNGASFKKIDLPITIYDKKGLSNTQRFKGLSENIAIIKELDSFIDQVKFLPRLYFVRTWNRLSHKLK